MEEENSLSSAERHESAKELVKVLDEYIEEMKLSMVVTNLDGRLSALRSQITDTALKTNFILIE